MSLDISGNKIMKKPNSASMAKNLQKTEQMMEQDIGSMFKRREVIGRGKFGVVYKGYHVKTKQVYAIKVLNLDSDEDEVEDVQREVQFLSSMKQIPNITHYYGSYLKDTKLWIIIEYCAGGSLRTLLRPGRIDEKYIGVIMREVLIALKYIHKDNVIHRDIKAANVLITNEGHVKLCDFGVAAQLNQSHSRRQTMAGTPYWMAPEVIMEGVYYDTKVDIWSLGITTYEIATGNPPYCEVEALRAMQLITKTKPPRLEERGHSSLLKEFIALCLDEDPKERLSADDLLKTKFVKTHKATSVTVLKQLITRYLLFRDKNKSARESTFITDEEQNANENSSDKNDASVGVSDNGGTNLNGLEGDVKWDFDSLSSSDYIMENDINVEEIPGEFTQDWTTSHNDQFNFAYPDEDQYYFYPTNNNGKVYQGTTMGKTQPSTVLHNSTLNAPLTNNNTTGNYPSKMIKTTNTTVGTGTHNNTATGNKISDTRVPKKLLELFEENDVNNEEVQKDPELSRVTKNISHLHMDSLPEDSAAQSVTDLGAGRPHVNLLNTNVYHSQSAPVLPLLQTKFSKPGKGPSTAVTTAPTPIEIEIPEELPTSAVLTPSATSDPLTQLQTKPRSSTVSIPSGPVPYKTAPGLSRRLTVGTTGREGNSVSGNPKKIAEEISRENSVNTDSSGDSVKSIPITTVGSMGNGSTNKYPLRSPSPSKMFLNHVASPTRKPGNSPTGVAGISNVIPLPTMKPIGNNGDNNKELLLQPLNTNTNTNIGSYGSPALSNDKEMSRVNRDFKRNNPNLKLHMPLPTTVAPNKLLDASAGTNGTNSNDALLAQNENINQFGFNTSSASNIPVSMTPINERHIDWGNRPKRSQSISNRKNSQSADPAATAAVNSVSSSNPSAPLLGMNFSSNSVNIASVLPNGNAPSTNSSTNAAINSSNSTVAAAAAAAAAANNTAINASNINGSMHSSNSINAPTPVTNVALMQVPPRVLNMDLFLDVDVNSSENYQWVDQKPHVLEELEALLKMYEEGLPVIENALKKQLLSSEMAIEDH